MDNSVSYRSINVENPQTAPKTASTAFFNGEWLKYASGKLAPLTPTVAVVGLCLTKVPVTDATTSEITYDGISSSDDRWTMPVANTLVYTVTSGVFQVGDIVTGSTSGAKAKVIKYTATTTIVIVAISGVFTPGETITGSVSGALGVVSSVTVATTATNLGQKADIAADFTSLDVATIGSGTQFVITRIMSATQVEVAVVLLAN
jgi:hypothetical protein